MQKDNAQFNVKLMEPDENVQFDPFGKNHLKIYIAKLPLKFFNDQGDHWGLIIQNVADKSSNSEFELLEKKDNFFTVNFGI